MKQHIILAIDPGLRALGLAVGTRKGKLLSAEVLTTDPKHSQAQRLRHLKHELRMRLDRFRPDLLLLETTWPTSCRPLSAAHQVTRLCRRLAAKRRIPVTEIPAKRVRQRVVGYGWASKAETAQVVAARYPELQIYLRQDRAWKERHFQNLFDAVALLLYEHQTRRIRRTTISSPAS